MNYILVLIGLLLVSTSLLQYAQDEDSAEDGEDGGYGLDEELDKEEEIRLHKEEFDVMDTNGNGKLELEELQVATKDEEIEDGKLKNLLKNLIRIKIMQFLGMNTWMVYLIKNLMKVSQKNTKMKKHFLKMQKKRQRKKNPQNKRLKWTIGRI